ncbi:MAG: glycosyltransferase family 2 protein [Nodosilinea sp.]
MSNLPLVSILVNNYNYGQFLPEAIDSALDQSYSNTEVIVVDDGSTDNSREIIKSYGSQIKPILKENGGQASAFNLGFEKSQGEIICFLDADDTFLPQKIERVVEIFLAYDDIGWCFHSLKLINSDSEVISVPSTSDETKKSGVYDITLDLINEGKIGGSLPIKIVTSGMCLRHNLLTKILPMPEEIRITSDDYIKYVALGLSEGFALLEQLSIQRIHGNNAYTMRNNNRSGIAKNCFLTAYWLRTNFPPLGIFSNKMFAVAIAVDDFKSLAKTLNEDSRLKEVVANYLSSSRYTDVFSIFARSFFYKLRYSLQKIGI